MTKDFSELSESDIILARHKICEVIRKARLDRQWSQGDLADRVGIKRTHISRIETGKYNFTVDNLLMIMKALQIERIDISDTVVLTQDNLRSRNYPGLTAVCN